MITTVTMNPSIDYALFSPGFEKGAINRFENCSCRPGGKGVNVSLLLAALGVETTALGFAAGFSGSEIVRLLKQGGCKTDFFPLPGGISRINVKIREPGGEETDFNGAGPQIPADAVNWLMEKISALSSEDTLVLSGSIPPSLPRDAYAELLRLTEGKGVLTVVDAAGQALLASLPCHPFLIKPNLEELEEISGISIQDTATAKECALSLQRQGARNVVVSMGERGALLAAEDGKCLFCRAPKGEPVSTVGAGDSLVAGFLYGWRLHNTFEGALRWGVAAGSATAFCQGLAAGEAVKQLWPLVGNPHLF